MRQKRFDRHGHMLAGTGLDISPELPPSPGVRYPVTLFQIYFRKMFAAPLVLGKMCAGTSWCKLFVAILDSIKACKEFEFALLGEKRNKQRRIN